MHDIPFSIEQVANLLQLQVKRRSAYQMYANCPFCLGKDGEHDKHGHLNVNFQKNVFRCNRCNIQGGMLDLYSLYFNLSRKEAYKDIVERLKAENKDIPLSATIKNISMNIEKEELPLEEKDKTYSELLKLLTLSTKHKENLKNRGLSTEEIENREYKTTPVIGMKRIAVNLLEKGCKLKGVPGFFIDSDGEWTLDIRGSGGIMIPVRDDTGKIQGIQIRNDKGYKKYTWLTSSERDSGTPASTYMHYSNFNQGVTNEVFITEGPLKADIASILSNRVFIALPGVSCYGLIEKNVKTLKWHGIDTIVNAMDMDRYTNANVMKNVEEMQKIIEKNGFKVINLNWNSKYKGIDDYLLSKKMQ